MQEPSKGRIVIAQVTREMNNGDDTAPAMITGVWERRPGEATGWLVNVKIMLDGPTDDWRTSYVLFDTEQQARAYGIGGLFWPPRV